MTWNRIYFAFPSKSTETSKLLVLIIDINVPQVTSKNQADTQKCLSCSSLGAEMMNYVLIRRKPLLDTFHDQLQTTPVQRCVSISLGVCPHRLPVFRADITDALRNNAGVKNQYLFSYMLGQCRCYMFSHVTSCSLQTSAFLFARATVLMVQDGLASVIQT